MKPYQFQWVVNNALALSGQPISREEYTWLHNEGIEWIINLREYPVYIYFDQFPLWERELHLEYFHIGTKDGTGFRISQFEELYSMFELAIEHRKKLLIHCAGGMGRTSTAFIGIMMKHEGLNQAEVLKKYKHKRWLQGISKPQQDSLVEWHKHLHQKPLNELHSSQ